MAKVSELDKDAWQAYRQSHFRDAALIWLQASDQSRELGNATDWYKYRFWVAEALNRAGHYAKALNLLLEIGLHEPADRPNYEASLAQTKLVQITLLTNPDYKQLQTYLYDYQQLTTRQKMPAGDLPHMQGKILFRQGFFNQALNAYEQAWQVYDNSGYVKYTKAFCAAECCLKLGQIKQAQDWLQAGVNTQENYQEGLNLAAALELQIALAVSTPSTLKTLPSLLSQLDDMIIGSQAGEDHCILNEFSVRVHLLCQPQLDPMQASHLAQQSLLRPLQNRKDVHNQFEYRLLILDFRLAALRFLVGIAAVDDLYYAQSQVLPEKSAIIDSSQCKKRLQRVLASHQQAKRYGGRIDKMLQCTYRQNEVTKRYQRIQEIAQYLGV